MIGVLFVSMGVAYWFYRRVKSDSRVIKDIIGDASLNGKSVEVSFLGGMASFKIGDSQSGNLKTDRGAEVRYHCVINGAVKDV